MKKDRTVVAVGFRKKQIALFEEVLEYTGRRTLGPLVADCAMIGLPIFRKMMNGGKGRGE